MILYHYPMSPFSEKLRLLLGYTDTVWQGVIVPEMPPRVALDPLLQGYRRIPVAQDGADIYCDTRLIASELAARTERPELAPANADETALNLSSDLEGDVFWACVASIPATQILKQLVRNISLLGAFRFIRDRAGVARDAVTKPMSPKQAKQVFATHLQELNAYLEHGSPFLGGETPDYLDFSAYHTLWFQCVVGEIPAPEHHLALMRWYRSMQAIGHGEHKQISAKMAQRAARGASPRPVESLVAHADLGKPVGLRPDDYALDETRGELVAVTNDRYVIAQDADVGRLHLHFPQTGFTLRRL